MMASTSWAIMSLMSEICLDACELALVYMSFLMPLFFASSLMDCVSAMRNGLTSFSDCENPTTASLSVRSGGLTLQTSPLACATSCWAFSPPPPALCPDFAPGGEHATISVRPTATATKRLTILICLTRSSSPRHPFPNVHSLRYVGAPCYLSALSFRLSQKDRAQA